jgi:hypothetical protein
MTDTLHERCQVIHEGRFASLGQCRLEAGHRGRCVWFLEGAANELHERCLRATEETLPCAGCHPLLESDYEEHFPRCPAVHRESVASVMETLVREERDRALEEAAELAHNQKNSDNRVIEEKILALKGAGR